MTYDVSSPRHEVEIENAITQWRAAGLKPPSLKAIIP